MTSISDLKDHKWLKNGVSGLLASDSVYAKFERSKENVRVFLDRFDME